MEIKKLYEYLYGLETNKPDPKEVAEEFIKTVTENIETFKEMVCYVDVLTRKSKEFLYFNELHSYVWNMPKGEVVIQKKYIEYRGEMVNNPEPLSSTGKTVINRRKEYGFSIEGIWSK